MLPEILTPIPGPRSRQLAARLRRYESRNSTYLAHDWPIFWQRAEGTNVWDADGNRFLDLTSAFGVTSLGHGHPELRAAAHQQIDTLLHAMGDVHPAEQKAALCEAIHTATFARWGIPESRLILGNSGFEAIEAALKTALLATGRPGIIAFHGGYHGLGFGALATGGLPYFRQPFRAQLPDIATLLHYPTRPEQLPDLETQLDTHLSTKKHGCILVEPIQGRGGCNVPPDGFLALLRRACDRHGTLLILDEIYTGWNRTGTLFACDHEHTTPDLLCIGKALTGGFPLSACVGRATIMDAWPESHGEALHTSTFLGHPLGCALALASIPHHTDPTLPARVTERGTRLARALHTATGISPRGRGLMLGLPLPEKTPAGPLLARALRDGILLLADGPRGDILSLTPPFTITDEEITHLATRLPEWLATPAK